MPLTPEERSEINRRVAFENQEKRLATRLANAKAAEIRKSYPDPTLTKLGLTKEEVRALLQAK